MEKGVKEGKVKKEISKEIKSIKKVVKGNWVQKTFFAIKILISLIVGFLPSFLFVALFIQYGSPFSNYTKFLFDISASWGAWISAVIISILINVIGKIIKSKESFKKIIKNKAVLIGLIFFITLLLALVVIQLYLYVNFTLRSDILVRLSSDKDNIFFINNSQEEVSFKISVLMNPFCSAQCQYKFEDISDGKNIETGTLNVTSVFSKTKTYAIENSHLVQGSQVINRFEISCVANKTWFCYTSGVESKRAVLLTINYNLSSEDIDFKNYSREIIIQSGKILFSSKELLAQAIDGAMAINNSFVENFSYPLENLSRIFNQMNNSYSGLESSWKLQGFTSLREILPDVSEKIAGLNADADKLNKEIISNISVYNSLAENLTGSRIILNELSQSNFNLALCTELNDIVFDFNSVVNNFQIKSNLSKKTILVGNIVSRINNLYNSVQSNTEVVSCSLTSEISNKKIDKIITNFSAELFPNLILEDPIPMCCFLGECAKCCDETCSKENYPVIFLHGQSINRALPTDFSLDSFTSMKEKLVTEGYIDAGAMIISSIIDPSGLWGEVNVPMIMTASYFFDIYKTATGEQTVSSNADNIDTYAIRLKKIIELVKYRTNKDKVILVAHSMGGVVARRYIQIFGGGDVDKAILIAVPNHGIDDKIKDFCAVIGPAASCNDLNKDSLFMNELNNEPTDIVPTYNIIGTGCDMGTETGEGFLKNSSQYLDSATNYYVNGICNELNFDFFHEFIIIPDKYPETYNLVKNILKNK